jgi:hypothetical protein
MGATKRLSSTAPQSTTAERALYSCNAAAIEFVTEIGFIELLTVLPASSPNNAAKKTVSDSEFRSTS